MSGQVRCTNSHWPNNLKQAAEILLRFRVPSCILHSTNETSDIFVVLESLKPQWPRFQGIRMNSHWQLASKNPPECWSSPSCASVCTRCSISVLMWRDRKEDKVKVSLFKVSLKQPYFDICSINVLARSLHWDDSYIIIITWMTYNMSSFGFCLSVYLYVHRHYALS